MVKIFAKDIYPALVALSSLINIDLNIKVSYKIARIVDALQNELKIMQEAEKSTREQALKQFGTKDKKGNWKTKTKEDGKEYYELTDDKAYEEFLKTEYAKLEDEPIELKVEPISINQLVKTNGDQVDVPAKGLVALSTLITE